VQARLPLLAKVMPYVGHGATRARGTIGGSLANGDHAAEIVLVAITLGATLCVRDGEKVNDIAADEFFLGPMVTALPPTGFLMAAKFPVWSEQSVGTGFHEINARQSDFAFVSAAAQVAVDAAGRCTRAAIGIGAATAVPLRLEAVAKAVEGRTFDENAVRQSLRAALADTETMADLHASADYRRRVAVPLAVRAIADAYRNANAR
jgi:CO/xanthine dehydrogenase FAD-binding subunit